MYDFFNHLFKEDQMYTHKKTNTEQLNDWGGASINQVSLPFDGIMKVAYLQSLKQHK